MSDGTATREERPEADVIVVGAGPAGISAALELAKRGHSVALVESGVKSFSAPHQELGDAEAYDPNRHAAMDLCTRRQVGGASNIWGGRLVPYDAVDFMPRDFISDAPWPVAYDEVRPYFGRACEYFFAGDAAFNAADVPEIEQKTIVPNLPDGDVRSSDLERWSLPTNFRREYQAALEGHPRITLLSGFTCSALRMADGSQRVQAIECTSLGGERRWLTAKYFVLVCGALEVTRLLQNCAARGQIDLGPSADWLGKCYMGHLSGRIARVVFETGQQKTAYGFHRDADGVYLRQRFTFSAECQLRERIANTALWLVNPPIGDAAHGNGVLSFAYLALRSPLGTYFASEAIRKSALEHSEGSTVGQHVRNMLRQLPATVAFIASFGVKRFLLWRRAPGFFQRSAANRYDLHYHAEHIPNPDSRVTLGDTQDAVGLRRLKIDFRYSEADVDSVLRCHELLDAYLREHRVGRLEYLVDDRRAAVWEQAADGFHQAGATRMANEPSQGVVDRNCRVFGAENLFVASGSNFVTSSQANTTFMIVVFGLRLVDHLCRLLSSNGLRADGQPHAEPAASEINEHASSP